MQTHGPVVADSTHSKFFLLRHRPPQFAELDPPELMQWVDIRRREVESSPADIQVRDRLVCDLLRLSGAVYESVRRDLPAPGAVNEAAATSLGLVAAWTDQAFDHLDSMPGLMLGAQATPRIAALNAAFAHNIAVSLFERGMASDGRDTARMGLQVLRDGQRTGRSELMAENLEPMLTALAS